jgi:hypothetical protein
MHAAESLTLLLKYDTPSISSSLWVCRNGSGIPDEFANLFKACNSDTSSYCYVDLLVQQSSSGSYSAYASCNAYEAAGECPGTQLGMPCIDGDDDDDEEGRGKGGGVLPVDTGPCLPRVTCPCP